MSTPVVISGKYLTLNVKGQYDIELSRINTEEKLLKWIFHLSEKQWVTREIIHEVIDKVAERFDLSVYGV